MKSGFILILAFIWTIQAHAQCPVIPTPGIYRTTGNHLILEDGFTVEPGVLPQHIFDFFQAELERFGIRLHHEEKGTPIFVLKGIGMKGEGYELNIENTISISAATDQGTFYAINSLLQLIQKRKEVHYLEMATVIDKPLFGWRGLHLDVSRHFFSVDDIKKYIDVMALYKFNKFHWHLTDDQGWRIEIKKYPKLTFIGGYRDSTVIGHYSDTPRKHDTSRYGGFYTQDEIREVVAYAKLKYIDVVPEIEMPGHSRAALAAYPEYSCTGVLQDVPGLWGVFDDIYCSKPETVDFMKDILSEVLELFPSEYIHIGGDEAPKTRWKSCKNCQKVIKDNSLKDEHELQSYFIQQIDHFLTNKGRKLIGWDEILEGGLSTNAAVMSWRGESGGIEAAKQGHYVVMSPTTYCYFDYYQSGHDIEPLAIGGYLPLEKVYKFNPIPDALSVEEAKYILGGQANLWTEYMATYDHVEYMAYPRALALIQSLWCVNKPDYQTFLRTYLEYQEDYLEAHNVNVAKSIHYPELIVQSTEKGIGIQFDSPDVNDLFEIKVNEMDGIQGLLTKRTINSLDILPINRSDSGGEKYNIELTSKEFDDTLRYNFTKSRILGCDVETVTAPHPKYNHNGGLNLVNGIKGGKSFKGTEWLGFREDTIELILDLKKNMEFNELQIGLLENNGSWIYIPNKILVYSSEDKENWIHRSTHDALTNGRNTIKLPKLNGRYIRLKIVAMDLIPEGKDGAGNIPWTFIDEIELFNRK